MTDRPQINYAPPPAPLARRRNQRLVIFLTIVATAVTAGLIFGPRLWNQCRLLYWQHQAMTFTAAPDCVVYDSDPASAAGLLKDLHYQAVDSAIVRDEEAASKYFELLNPPGRRVCATLFLHERKTSGGRRRLVIVTLYRIISGELIETQAVDPAGFFSRSRTYFPQPELFLPLSPPQSRVRFYAGQPDPRDESHFTIQATTGDETRILDGWLTDDGEVKLAWRNDSKPLTSLRSPHP
jgi:hypothetical protein